MRWAMTGVRFWQGLRALTGWTCPTFSYAQANSQEHEEGVGTPPIWIFALLQLLHSPTRNLCPIQFQGARVFGHTVC